MMESEQKTKDLFLNNNQYSSNDNQQMCYVPYEPVFKEIEDTSVDGGELSDAVCEVYNSRVKEIQGNDVFMAISSYQDANELNRIYDEAALENERDLKFNTLTELVERGLPTSMAIELYNKQKDYRQAYGSGLYSALLDSRVIGQASDNNVMASAYIDKNDTSADLYESMQNMIVNLQMINDMAVKANDRNNERNIFQKAAVGIHSALPLEENWNAVRRFKNIVKNRLGDSKEIQEIGDSWNANKVFEATCKALMNKETMSTNDFKQILNDIDQDLLEDGGLTLGDRANFWNQVIDTTIGLNRFAFGAELVGIMPIIKGASKAATTTAKATGSLVAGISKGALETAKMASSVDAVVGVSKTLAKPLSLLRSVGAKKKAKEMMDNLLNASVIERTIDPDSSSNAIKNASREWLENGMPNAFSPNALKTPNTVSTKNIDIIADAMEGIEDADDAVQAISIARELDNGVIKDLKKDILKPTLQDFAERYLKNKNSSKYVLENVNMVSNDKGFSLHTIIGTGDDYKTPFASVKKAKDYADKITDKTGKYESFMTTDKAEVIVTSDGAFVKIERTFNDGDKAIGLGDLVSASIKASELAGKTKGKGFSKSAVAKFLAGANITSDYTSRVLNNLKQAEEGRVLRLFTPFYKKLKDVKGSNGIILDALREETAKQGAFFTTKALRNAGIPEDVIEGYRALKIMDDASWLTRMKNTAEGMMFNDVKNIQYKGSRVGLGQIIDRPDRETINIITDMIPTDNGYTPKVKRVSMSEVKSEQHKFIRLTHSIDGDNIVAIHNSSFNFKDPSVMDTLFSYKPGRMSFSQGTGFIKQVIPTDVKLANGSTKTIPSEIRTLFAHNSFRKVEEAANVLEAFRQEAIKVSKGKSITQAQIDIQNIPGWEKVGSFEKFYNLTQGDNPFISLDPRAELKFVRDGENIMFNNEPVKDFNFKGSSTSQYTNSEYMLRTKKRGDSEIFNPFTFGEAPRLNAMEEMNIATQNMLRYSSLDDYTKMYADNFMSSFSQYFLDKNRSAMNYLLYFNVNEHKSDIPFGVRQQIQNAQLNFKRMMSTASPIDELIENAAGALADKLVPDLKKAGPIRTAFYDSLAGANPIRKAKAFTFNWFLSGFNPKQLFTQAAASLNAIDMHPILGTYATTYHLPILSYMNSGDGGVLNKAYKLFGLGNEKELKEVAAIAKKLDVFSQATPAGAFELGTKQASLGGTSWFDPSAFYLKGEYANRTLTAIMAAKEAYDKGFRASTMKAADFANLTVRQQNLYLNMGRAGTSELQRGFMGFLTQFKGYQMRFIESMIDGELTAAEKLRLAGGAAIMGGFKGFVGKKYAPKIYASMFADRDEPYTPFEELAYHGAVDYVAQAMGSDRSLSSAWSVGLADLASMVLEEPLVEMAPAYSALGKPLNAIAGIYKEFKSFMSLEPTDRKLSSLASSLTQRFASEKTLPGGLNQWLVGYYMLKNGEKLSSNGTLTLGGQDALDSFFTTIGFNNISEDKFSEIIAQKQKFEDDDREQTRFAQQLMAYMMNSPSDEQRVTRQKEVNSLISAVATDNPELGERIYKKVYSIEEMRGDKQERLVRLLESILGDGKLKYREDFSKYYLDAKARSDNN